MKLNRMFLFLLISLNYNPIFTLNYETPFRFGFDSIRTVNRAYRYLGRLIPNIWDTEDNDTLKKLGFNAELEELKKYLIYNDQDGIDKFLSKKINLNGFIVSTYEPLPTWEEFVDCYKFDKETIESASYLETYIDKISKISDEFPLSYGGITPLMFAVKFGTPETVEKLLKAGANPDFHFDKSYLSEINSRINKLITELKEPKYKELISKVIKNKNMRCNTEKVSENVADPLSDIHKDMEEILKELTWYREFMGSINRSMYQTPLMLAILREDYKDSLKIVESLLKYKADVNEKDALEQSALTYTAIRMQSVSFLAPDFTDEELKYSRKRAIVEKLIDHGADLEQQDIFGCKCISKSPDYTCKTDLLLKQNEIGEVLDIYQFIVFNEMKAKINNRDSSGKKD